MRTRLACTAVLVTSALLMLSGCASADPIATLDPAPADAAAPPVDTFVTVMSELTWAFTDADDGAATVIPEGAGVDVAIAELTAHLRLDGEAAAFAAATATELARGEDPVAGEVEFSASGGDVMGELDGDLVATVDLTQRTQDGGPITEERTSYALGYDGDTLTGVWPWGPGVDSGVGLDSPTGAAQRFVDLVRDGQIEAVLAFSGDTNTTTEIEVLTSRLTADLHLVQLPQFHTGDQAIVYAVDTDNHVIARFTVVPGAQARVVYWPTS